jgi:hypothetical protein
MCGIPVSGKLPKLLALAENPHHCTSNDPVINEANKGIVTPKTISRRALVKAALVAGGLVPIAGLFRQSVAYGDSPPLDPGEQTARSLNYVTKSTKPDAYCGNCSQYQGKAGDAMGPCAIFPGKSVAAAGWCSGWAKKLPA